MSSKPIPGIRAAKHSHDGDLTFDMLLDPAPAGSSVCADAIEHPDVGIFRQAKEFPE
jgi:hypothetical protein